jgi:hypothetical protein
MSRARSSSRITLALFALLALGGAARADGIDIGAWVLQLPSMWGPGAVLGFIVLSLLIDYGLNLVVIGLLAQHWSGLANRRIARDLVPYTLWAQVADRAGALLSVFVAAGMDHWLDHSSEAYFVVPLFVTKIVLSAILIAFVVWRFARKRWSLSRGRSAILCVAGGVLTNPGLGMIAAIWLLEPSR